MPGHKAESARFLNLGIWCQCIQQVCASSLECIAVTCRGCKETILIEVNYYCSVDWQTRVWQCRDAMRLLYILGLFCNVWQACSLRPILGLFRNVWQASSLRLILSHFCNVWQASSLRLILSLFCNVWQASSLRLILGLFCNVWQASSLRPILGLFCNVWQACSLRPILSLFCNVWQASSLRLILQLMLHEVNLILFFLNYYACHVKCMIFVERHLRYILLSILMCWLYSYPRIPIVYILSF